MKNKNGFTMIELLIVIVIMGILSAIGLGTFTSSQLKARDSSRKSDLRTIGDALEVFYNDFGRYPLSNGGLITGCGLDADTDCSPGNIWKNTRTDTTYMVQMPEDPNGGTYYYVSDATGSYYQIYAHLENDLDREIPVNVSDEKTYYTVPETAGGSCVTGNCNYGRSSSNVNLGGTF